ncbi:MAG: hypothetical protein PHG06_13055 [Parabacteroides sp.]|nr:hypothetical protein [Parabacteroides sp.]
MGTNAPEPNASEIRGDTLLYPVSSISTIRNPMRILSKCLRLSEGSCRFALDARQAEVAWRSMAKGSVPGSRIAADRLYYNVSGGVR